MPIRPDLNTYEAISRSITHNETVHLDATTVRTRELLAECSDYVGYKDDDGGRIVEYWGSTCGGKDWKVTTHAKAEG